MVIKVTVPMLGWTMKEGVLTKWLKKEGEFIAKGEPLFELETEKALTEVEAPGSGILRKILVPEGSTVKVSEVVALIAEPDEEIECLDYKRPEDVTVTTSDVAQLKKPERLSVKINASAPRIKISPAARKMAIKHQIDITKLVGTGPGGRITRKDVMEAIQRLSLLPKVKQVIPLTPTRKTIAERLAYSYRTAVHASIGLEVDMTEILRLREELNKLIEPDIKTKVSLTDILIKVTACALREHPILNSTLDENEIKVFEDINIGLAVASERGLIVPVIRQADKKSLKEIVLIRNELVQKARYGKLTVEDVTGSTFTISNMGMYGITSGMSIINPPEVAILSVGAVVEKPVAKDGKIEIRPMMGIGLSFDHRVIDGATAALFLHSIKNYLESPKKEIFYDL